ncbi:MAG: glycosyltransferase [Planctomycetota bacterium]
MSVSFVVPTRDRPDELARTLAEIGRYSAGLLGTGRRAGGAEVIVIDNASEPAVETPTRLENGVRVELIRSEVNLGTAARNLGAQAAGNAWLVMLDDDSHPVASSRDGARVGDFVGALAEAPSDVSAVGGEIFLPSGQREAGGLPEVIVGCGAAVRRDAFLSVGGYDRAFDYYAEEYDLCAKLLARGDRVMHSRAIRFEHRKVSSGRDFGRILRRLVRNNGWVIERHAPDAARADELGAMLARYRAVGEKEGVREAFWAGLQELRLTSADQERRPLSTERWDRLTGAAAVRQRLLPALGARGEDRVRLVMRAKGAGVIERGLSRAGIEVRDDAQAAVVGRLSPGPVLDALSMDAGPSCESSSGPVFAVNVFEPAAPAARLAG